MLRFVFFSLFCFALTLICGAQTDSSYTPKFKSYQIYLKKPVQEIKELLYEKDCSPIDGKISGTQKSIIMDGYEPGHKVHIKVLYTDGTEDEFVRSPCYIDPVIL